MTTVAGGGPRLSIGLPVHNGENYLAVALESLLGQTYSDFEIIISDNASTDATEAICREFQARDPRVRYVRQATNIGAAANYNATLELARGQLFKWAAHDDVCLPDFLARCVAALDDAGPRAVLAYSAGITIDEHGERIVPDPYAGGDELEPSRRHAPARVAHTLRQLNMVNAVFGVIRRDALERTRAIDAFVASDYVLMVELAMLGTFVRVDPPMLERRIHPQGSRYANQTLAEVATWFAGPRAGARRPIFPARLRLMLEYHRSCWRVPSSPWSRLACALVVLPVLAERRLRVTVGRLRRRRAPRRSPEVST